MNNTTTATMLPTIIITECADHGVKSAANLDTARLCVRIAREDAHEVAVFNRAGAPSMHAREYHDDGTDCWVCCEKMVIDPQGVFDH